LGFRPALVRSISADVNKQSCATHPIPKSLQEQLPCLPHKTFSAVDRTGRRRQVLAQEKLIQRFTWPELVMEAIFTAPIWDSVSIVLINMLSDIIGILSISVSKAASLAFSTSVAESYIVIRHWSRSAFISMDLYQIPSAKNQRSVSHVLSGYVQAPTCSLRTDSSFLRLNKPMLH
jgi:hypothetical protein